MSDSKIIQFDPGFGDDRMDRLCQALETETDVVLSIQGDDKISVTHAEDIGLNELIGLLEIVKNFLTGN